MCKYQHKTSRIMSNQINMIPSKETNKPPIIYSKKMESYEFRMILLKFSELQSIQLNEIRKTMLK